MREHNPSYVLKIKETLTSKPENFYMHVTPRKGLSIPASVLVPAPSVCIYDVIVGLIVYRPHPLRLMQLRQVLYRP